MDEYFPRYNVAYGKLNSNAITEALENRGGLESQRMNKGKGGLLVAK